MLHARNCSLRLGDTDMDYISFGSGREAFVILPGLGDALKTVKGTALPMALMYRLFAREFRVFMFSRKNTLPEDHSIRDMAKDQARAMELLGLSNACVMGVSQGGMIAALLAAEHPELVKKLVLANTAACSNDTIRQVVGPWVELARAGDFRAIFTDTAEKSYTEKKLRLYRPIYPLLSALSRPKSLGRFITQANACLHFDAIEALGDIQCPTLIIGGDQDKIVGPDAAAELGEKIPHAELFICGGLGHAAYEEYPGFNAKVLAFLRD